MDRSDRTRAERRHEQDQGWARALQSAIGGVIGESPSAERAVPRATLLSVSPGGTRFEIELRFQAGKSYCCAEPGCFLPTHSRAWWMRLREALRDHCDREPPPFTMVVHGVVESGARLQALASCGLPAQSAAYTYRHGPLRERDAIH